MFDVDITTLESYIDDIMGEDSIDDSSLLALESTIDTALEGLEDEQNNSILNLEVAIEMATIAVESEMGELEVEKLLTKAKSVLEDKILTVEDADKYLNKIESESTKFNNALTEMKTAGEELQTDQIDKQTFKERVKPYMNELEESCSALGLVDVENNVANLKAFIVGIHQYLSMKREELSRGNGDDTPSDDVDDDAMIEAENALESFLELDNDNDDDESEIFIIE